MSVVKHLLDWVMFWGCLGPGYLAVIKSSMNSAVYQGTKESNVGLSVHPLKLVCNWDMLQNNNFKHTSKSITERLEREKNQCLVMAQSKSPKVIEELWWERVVH